MLDETDRKILHILDGNSRASNTAIAKKTGISKQLLKYRIDRLVEKGVIEKFYTVVNSVKLGFTYFRIYLRLHGITSDEERELVESFASNEYVTWAVKCRGQWDIVASIYARDAEHFSTNLQDILGGFQGNILKKKIVLIRNAISSTRNYLSKDEKSLVSGYGGTTEYVAIDDVDHGILLELTKNSRVRVVDLAKKMDSAPATIRSRLERMEKAGLIKAHKLFLDYSGIGVLFFIISITLSNASKASRFQLEKYCNAHPNVVYYVNLLGNHEIDLEVEVEKQGDIDDLLVGLKNRFPSIIRDMEIIQVTRQYKRNHYPFRSKPA